MTRQPLITRDDIAGQLSMVDASGDLVDTAPATPATDTEVGLFGDTREFERTPTRPAAPAPAAPAPVQLGMFDTSDADQFAGQGAMLDATFTAPTEPAPATPAETPVRVDGTNGHGQPLTLDGYITHATATGQAARVFMSATPGGRGRPVYVDLTDAPAADIRIGDFIACHACAGLVRVVDLPARDVFSQCYYYRNVLDAAGHRHEFKDTEPVRGLFIR